MGFRGLYSAPKTTPDQQMNDQQQAQIVDDALGSPRRHAGERTHCGRVIRAVADDACGTVWIETDTHGMSVDWPTWELKEDLPGQGELVSCDGDQATVYVGEAGQERSFTVVHQAWDYEMLAADEKQARTRFLQIVLVTVALVAMVAAQFAGSLADAVSTDATSFDWMPRFGVALLLLMVLGDWRANVALWTTKSVIGIAARPVVVT